MKEWQDFELTVGMPHMVPGKLSEVELLKVLGDRQWSTISGLLGVPSREIVNEQGDRLYASFIDVELCMAPRALELFGEGERIQARNRAGLYARKLVEGMFVFDGEAIGDDVLAAIGSRDDLRGIGVPWAYMTNAFIARFGANDRLKVFEPRGLREGHVPETSGRPGGISDHERVQSTGCIEPLGGPEGEPLMAIDEGLIPYPVVPESDLNGAGLLYFARYPAIMNYGERVFLSECLSQPLSTPLIQCLSTVHRRIYYFANAAPWETINIQVGARLLPAPESGPPSPRYRTPLEMLFRIDLFRASDNTLMASSLVRKAVNVPAKHKALLAEAERFRCRYSG